MEKFAVDLDKVLDDFEFNEDCAEQIASVANPIASVTLSRDKLTTDPTAVKVSSINSRRIIHGYEISSFEQQENNTIKESKPSVDKSIIVPLDINYHKDDLTSKCTDTVNNFHTETEDRKIANKQPVYLQNVESTSSMILNNTSQTLLVKKQNGNSNQQIQNRYDKKLNQPHIKPTLSNVFTSLNEYINAPTISLDYETDMSNKQAVKLSKECNSFDDEINTSKNDKDVIDYNLIKSTSSKDKASIVNVETYNNTHVANDVDYFSLINQDTVENEKQLDKYNTRLTDTFHSLEDTHKDAYHDSDALEILESCINVNKQENECINTECNKNAIYSTENINFNSKDSIKPEEVKYESDESETEEENKEFYTTKALETETASANTNDTFLNNTLQIQSNIEPLVTNSSKPTNFLQPKQKVVGFSNIDDLSEEELNKYLETLEEEEKVKKEISPSTVSSESSKNSAENIEKNILLQEMQIKDEDKSAVNDNTEICHSSKSRTSTEKGDCSVDKIQEAIINKNYNDITEKENLEKPNSLSRLIVICNKEQTEERNDKAVDQETNHIVDTNCTKDNIVATNQSTGETQSCKSRIESNTSNMKVEPSQSEKSNELQDSERNNNKISELKIHSNTDYDTKDKNFKLHGNENLNDNVHICIDNDPKNINIREENGPTCNENNEEVNKPVRPQTLDITSAVTVNEHITSDNAGSPNDTSGQQSQPTNADSNCGVSTERSDNTAVECIKILGKQPPFWIPDSDAPSCMLCDIKFTVLKRRHHCRACGKVLCSKCCNMKYRLEYQGNIDSRVCNPCYNLLMKAENGRGVNNWSSNYANNSEINSPQGRSPNPNNPMEYCSTIPPLQQVAGGLQPPPAVMVPVGVLKREGSTKQRPEGSKSVMFSDGIRPGCDLTELDTSWDLKPPYRKSTSKRLPALDSPVASSSKRQNLPTIDPETNSYIPQDPNVLPPTVTIHKGHISYHNVTDQDLLYKTLKNECEPPIMFAINRNLYVYVKITNLNCCVNRICWNITSKGLACVGQDEIILLVETLPDETQIPKDLFLYINHIYIEAMKGNTMTELSVSIYQGGNLLGSREHAGFLFIRQTLQCLQKIVLPPAPFLIGLLIHRWETPWAKVFPLRLLLRLGAEYRYYPCPLVSVRFRDALYFEIGHTVMKVLADFRNFGYTLPSVRGLTIHLKSRTTDVMFPKNRYDQVIKGLNNSNDHVLAFASNFSISADSHLVCIQTNTGDESSYQTQAINIQNKPRTVTGASFIVINGALKSSMGLSAKSSIVEDGLMVEIMPEKMEALKAALKNMQDFSIGCGRLGAAEPDETVNIKWVDNDVQFNLGVKSPIDGRLMDGVPSIRVHNATDYKGTSRFIRWTEVFIIKSDDHPNGVHDPMDINKLSESIARATCAALVKLLDLLATAGLTKIGVRTTIHPDSVGYEAGSEGAKLPPIYMNSLDNELIQILHKAAQSSQDTHTVLELIFYVLDD